MRHKPSLFVFAGEVYVRDFHPHVQRGSSLEALSYCKDLVSENPQYAILLACTATAIYALVNEIALPFWNSAFKHKGIPKFAVHKETKTTTVAESKGEELKISQVEKDSTPDNTMSLADKLKMLSANMSIERAQTTMKKKSSVDSLSGVFEKVNDCIHRLQASRSLEYKYQLSKQITEIKGVVDKLKALWTDSKYENIDELRSQGKMLANALLQAEKRDKLPFATTRLFFLLHITLVRLHEAFIFYVFVPNLSDDIDVHIKANPDSKTVGDAMQKIIKEICQYDNKNTNVPVSNLLQSTNDQHAKRFLKNLSIYADELRACKSITSALDSVKEISCLVEGVVLSKLVGRLQARLTMFWPASNESAAQNMGESYKSILDLYLRVRSEQQRRVQYKSNSTGDVALWKHLVNACDSLVDFVFMKKTLASNEQMQPLIESIAEVVGFFQNKNLGMVGSSTDLSFDTLIMDASLTYRKSVISSSALVQQLKYCDSAIVRSLYAAICRSVESSIPGSQCALSIGTSVGVSASCGLATENDVVVSLVTGSEGGKCKLLLFVATELPARLQSIVFDAIPALLDSYVPTPVPEVDAVQIPQAAIRDMATSIPMIESLSLPSHWSLSSATERDNFVNRFGQQASIMIDDFSLRSEPTTTKACVTVSSKTSLICCLEPRVVLVLSKDAASIQTICTSISRVS